MITKVVKVKKAKAKKDSCCDCFGGGCRCRDWNVKTWLM